MKLLNLFTKIYVSLYYYYSKTINYFTIYD